jgi:hypothetical protein
MKGLRFTVHGSRLTVGYRPNAECRLPNLHFPTWTTMWRALPRSMVGGDGLLDAA